MAVTEFRDRHPLGGELDPTPDMTPVLPACAVVGHGRLGTALAAALRAAGAPVDGPLGRGATASAADVVLLSVPDAEIADAAAQIAPGRLVGHCSGATTLAPLAGHSEAFSLHPLMTVTAAGADFAGATAAIAGTTDAALTTAAHAGRGARSCTPSRSPTPTAPPTTPPRRWPRTSSSRCEGAAERVGGLDRAALAPLVRATVDNWVADGARAALTGPDRPRRRGDRRHASAPPSPSARRI